MLGPGHLADDGGTVTAERALPDEREVQRYLSSRRNWGRWGDDDQLGTLNLITPEKRVAAAGAVRTGRTVSLARPLPTRRRPDNPSPTLAFWTKSEWPNGGGHAADFVGLESHGHTTTHLDALCHLWDRHGIYNQRDPEEEISFRGARFGGIEAWSGGIFTRAVFLDVPRHRGISYVDHGDPVHGWELDEIASSSTCSIEPGDAVCVYSGREAWQRANPDRPYGFWTDSSGKITKPGLHATCLEFLRDHDVSVLVWDMLDEWPIPYDIPWTVHGAIHAYGLALLDNALLEPLAEACQDEGRDDMLLVVAPLVFKGGTGSAVNPLAIF
jgi:kynurenine formamidase